MTNISKSNIFVTLNDAFYYKKALHVMFGEKNSGEIREDRPAGMMRAGRADQTEKLEPQPQVVVAFGFCTVKRLPCKPSV